MSSHSWGFEYSFFFNSIVYPDLVFVTGRMTELPCVKPKTLSATTLPKDVLNSLIRALINSFTYVLFVTLYPTRTFVTPICDTCENSLLLFFIIVSSHDNIVLLVPSFDLKLVVGSLIVRTSFSCSRRYLLWCRIAVRRSFSLKVSSS